MIARPSAMPPPHSSPAARPNAPLRPLWHWLAWIAAAGLMGLAFALYTHPAFMVDMADRLWACF